MANVLDLAKYRLPRVVTDHAVLSGRLFRPLHVTHMSRIRNLHKKSAEIVDRDVFIPIQMFLRVNTRLSIICWTDSMYNNDLLC